jgi:ubiquinone/menaquinone biosynthesis C-methylase UbiE
MQAEMNENLRDAFNQIAPGWYNYRHWTIFRTELEALASEWGQGKLLNVGCGHGADFLPFAKTFDLYGLDFSDEMIRMAQKYSRKFEFPVNLAVGDICALPYNNEAFDYAIAVATYHHLKKEQQLQSFLELKRVLKPGATAFVTVWNRWQPKFRFKGKEIQVPWRTQNGVLNRYYYLFTYNEMKALARKAGFEIIKVFPEASYKFPVKQFSENICIILKRG